MDTTNRTLFGVMIIITIVLAILLFIAPRTYSYTYPRYVHYRYVPHKVETRPVQQPHRYVVKNYTYYPGYISYIPGEETVYTTEHPY